MRSHKLDRRIALLSSTSSINDLGESVFSWSTNMSVWAQVKYRSGSEDFSDGIEVNTQSATFIIRYQATLTTKYRVLFDGNTYDIEAITDPRRKELMELECTLIEV